MDELTKTVENAFLKLKKFSGMHTIVMSILFVIGMSLRLWYVNSFGIYIDEANYAYIASEILRGKIVYKDIVHMKMPYFYFSIALIFFIFGKSIVYPRFVAAFLSTLTLVLVYLIGKELYDKKIGLISAGIYVFDPLTIFWSRYTITEHYMTFFAAFAIYAYSLYRNQENIIYLFLSGILTGVSFFMKQPGIITLLVIFVCIFIDTFGKEVSNKKETIAKHVFVSLVGVIIAILPGLTYFWLHNALGDFIYLCFFAITAYKSLILVRLKIFYVVLNYNVLIWSLGLSGILFTLKRKRQSDLIVLSFFLIPFIILVSLQSFLDHYFLQIIPFLSILSGIFLSKLLFFAEQLPMKEFPHGKTISGAVIIGIVLVPYAHSFPFIFYSFEGKPLFNPAGSLNENKKVGHYLEEQTSPGEKIFAFNPRYIFLANRETVCKYIYIDDWYLLNSPNREIIYQEIFDALVSSKVNYAVFASTLTTLQRRYSVPELLRIINYIQENYTLEIEIGYAFIYRYKGSE